MTRTIVYLPEPDDWESAIPCKLVWRTVDRYWDVVKILQSYQRNSIKYGARLSLWNFLSVYEDIMPRAKVVKNGTASNGGNNSGGKGSDAQWKWVNCKLSDDDIFTLEQDVSTLEYLSTCLVSLGADGFGFSCKPVDEGKSYCCTIYRSDFPRHGVTVGVSAFAGNLRDAILSCLYKLDNYCGGDFSNADTGNDAGREKPRFR